MSLLKLLVFILACAGMLFFGWLTWGVASSFLASTTIVHAIVYGVIMVILLVVDVYIFMLGILGVLVAAVTD